MRKKRNNTSRELKALQKSASSGITISRRFRLRSRQGSRSAEARGCPSTMVGVRRSRRLTLTHRRLQSRAKNDASKNQEDDEVTVVKVEPASPSPSSDNNDEDSDIRPGGSTEVVDSEFETEMEASEYETCDEEEDELDFHQDHTSDHGGLSNDDEDDDESHDIAHEKRKLVESPSPGPSSGVRVVQGPKSGKGNRKTRARKRSNKWSSIKNKKKKLSATTWKVTDKDGNERTEGKITFTCQTKENYEQEIYGCRFLHTKISQEYNYFATVGSNRVTVYRCGNNASIKAIQRFADPNKNEVFYCCAWSNCSNNKPLLAAAGKNAIIRIFSLVDAQCLDNFTGHSGAINDLKFHPRDDNLLFTASEDQSVRLWNIRTNVTVVIFGGLGGHSDQVLHVDIFATSTVSRMISGGMDDALIIWDLMTPEITRAIERSRVFDLDNASSFATHMQHFPDFATAHVHLNYVDCVKWFGNFLFSKSFDNEIICWKPGLTLQSLDDALASKESEISVIDSLELQDCELWFIKFDLDLHRLRLACGSASGKIHLFEMFDNLDLTKVSILEHPDCKSTIREVSFSADGKILIAVCDDATIWRWNINL